MFTTFLFVSLFVAFFRTAVAQESTFTIDTPNLVQCQAAQITWSATDSPPYDLLVVSAQDVCGESLEDLGNQTSTSMTWTVNLAAGTEVILSLEDSAGNEAWSGSITVAYSNDSSCLNSSPGMSGSPSSTPLPSSTGTSSVPPHTSPTSSIYAPAGAANAGLDPSTSGALVATRPVGAATLVGAAVLAVFAFAL